MASRARLSEVLARLEVAENEKRLRDRKRYGAMFGPVMSTSVMNICSKDDDGVN